MAQLTEDKNGLCGWHKGQHTKMGMLLKTAEVGGCGTDDSGGW